MIDNVRCPRNLIVSMGCTLKLFMIDLRYPQVNLGRMLVVSQLEILWWIHRCGLAPPPTLPVPKGEGSWWFFPLPAGEGQSLPRT